MITHPIATVPLKFGTIGGALTILMFLITYWMGKNPIIDLGFFDFIILPIFIFFSMKEFRDYRNERILHFWQGMTVGVISYLAIATISAMFILLFLTAIDPGLLDAYITDRIEIIDLKKAELVDQMGEETYTKTRQDTFNTSAGILSLDDFIKKCLIGFTLTIPMAVLLRRRQL